MKLLVTNLSFYHISHFREIDLIYVLAELSFGFLVLLMPKLGEKSREWCGRAWGSLLLRDSCWSLYTCTYLHWSAQVCIEDGATTYLNWT